MQCQQQRGVLNVRIRLVSVYRDSIKGEINGLLSMIVQGQPHCKGSDRLNPELGFKMGGGVSKNVYLPL